MLVNPYSRRHLACSQASLAAHPVSSPTQRPSFSRAPPIRARTRTLALQAARAYSLL